MLAKAGELDGALAGRQASAKHHHVVGDLLLVQVVVVHDDHVGAVKSRNRRNVWDRAHGDDEGVRPLCLDPFRRGLAAQADVDACCATEALVGAHELVHLALEGNRLLALEDAAQLVGLLHEDDLVSAACGRPCGVEASGSAACHHDLAPALGRHGHHLVALELAPDDRVHGAASGARGGSLGHAGEAAQAAHYLVGMVLCDLAGQVGVGEQGASHVDHVGLA